LERRVKKLHFPVYNFNLLPGHVPAETGKEKFEETQPVQPALSRELDPADLAKDNEESVL
jgi:hypothetical protein